MKKFTVTVPQNDGTSIAWKFRAISQADAELLAGWKMYYQYKGEL